MKFRLATVLLALALPVAAQDHPAAAEAEGLFYKAFYLEKGQRDFVGAMALYEEFLGKAPEHKLAAEAAKQNFQLLDRTGKTKERDAFKTKYSKLLGNIASAPAAGDASDTPPAGRGDGARGDGARGAGRGEAGARPDSAARLAELEKQLAKAKEEGNAEEQKRLEQQIERLKQAPARGQGAQRRGGLMGLLASDKKLKDMSEDEMKSLKDGLGQSSTMIDRMREAGQDDLADKLETNINSLKKALDANKLDDAQKAVDALKEAMPRRGGRGGGGGDAGGGRAGGGGGGTGGTGGGGGNGGGGGR